MSLLAFSGCGSPSGMDKTIVVGTASFDGQPIANGEVRFYPTQGTAGPVSGAPIKDGRYEARGKGGVPVGKHRVEVRGFRPQPGATGEGGVPQQYLPAKYNEQSELIVEISTTGGGESVQDFTLEK